MRRLISLVCLMFVFGCQPETYIENRLERRLEGTAPPAFTFHHGRGGVRTEHHLGPGLSHDLP